MHTTRIKLAAICILSLGAVTSSWAQQSETDGVIAQTSGPHPSLLESFMGGRKTELEREALSRQNALIQSQIETARLRLELQKIQGGEQTANPEVIAIIGVDNQFKARLRLANGSHQMVSEGDHINEQQQIQSITSSGVMMSVGKGKNQRIIRLQSLATSRDDSLTSQTIAIPPMLRTQ